MMGILKTAAEVLICAAIAFLPVFYLWHGVLSLIRSWHSGAITTQIFGGHAVYRSKNPRYFRGVAIKRVAVILVLSFVVWVVGSPWSIISLSTHHYAID